MKRSTISAITARTDAQWPPDHPLRKIARVVLTNRQAEQADFLVCTFVGEERAPPEDDDRDVTGACARCGVGIVWRASAPGGPLKICWRCWRALG